jgi:hypothetical protein
MKIIFCQKIFIKIPGLIFFSFKFVEKMSCIDENELIEFVNVYYKDLWCEDLTEEIDLFLKLNSLNYGERKFKIDNDIIISGKFKVFFEDNIEEVVFKLLNKTLKRFNMIFTIEKRNEELIEEKLLEYTLDKLGLFASKLGHEFTRLNESWKLKKITEMISNL